MNNQEKSLKIIRGFSRLMSLKLGKHLQLQPGAVFAMLFVITAATATAIAAYLPQPILDLCQNITINSTTVLCNMFGIPVSSSDDKMTVNGFAMRIITQCTALHYIIILSTGILLYSK